MNIQAIEAFLAVIRTGSLTEAARQLHLTQPTLSHRLQTLEAELGATLLIRGKGQRRIELTDAGRDFVPLAESWRRLWSESLRITSRPVFRVAATQTLSSSIMPEVYAGFARRGLPTALDVKTLHSQEAYGAVEQGELDAAFIANTMFSKRVSAIPVLEERMVLLCGGKSTLDGPVRPADLPAEKGVFLSWTHEFTHWYEYWFGLNRHVLEADNMSLVEPILASSDLWAIVPASAAVWASREGRLRCLELVQPPPDRVVYLLTLEPPSPYTSYLLEEFRAAAGRIPAPAFD
ncbi:LysR family transcriptional regulator [Oscillibacter hominis]|uniref:LysR family transcriptional regulator n=1 Tax=Oscillibacter hominis TaxID=2763056 RepID=A0A7G9B502_9FIRM|nr:LysR family transcriptional regulator [Oscillibacter hominis]QNL44633.1 LysR family transcriptional regulator [Oscillibacter hominis]